MKRCKECTYWFEETETCFRSIEIPENRTQNDCCDSFKKKNNRLTNDFIYNDGNIKKELTIVTYEDLYKKLYSLEEEEEKGFVIHLPCPIGSTIYSVFKRKNFFVKESVLTYYNLERVLEEFGYTVFLTRKEAEDLCDKYNKLNNKMDVYYVVHNNTMTIYDHDSIIAEVSIDSKAAVDEWDKKLYDVVNDDVYLNDKYGRKAVLDYLNTLLKDDVNFGEYTIHYGYESPHEGEKWVVIDNKTGKYFVDEDGLIHAFDTKQEAIDYLRSKK